MDSGHQMTGRHTLDCPDGYSILNACITIYAIPSQRIIHRVFVPKYRAGTAFNRIVFGANRTACISSATPSYPNPGQQRCPNSKQLFTGPFQSDKRCLCNGCWICGRMPSLVEHYTLIDSYPLEWGFLQTLVVDEDLKAACIVQIQCFLKSGVAQEDFFQNQSSTSRATKPNKSSKKAAKIASQPGDRQSQPQQTGYPTDAAQRGMLPIPISDIQSLLDHSAFSNQHPPQL